MNDSALSDDSIFLVFIVGIFAVIFIIAFYMNVWIPFVNKRRYIKMEMSRGKGRRQKYWKTQLRYLYIEHIPLVGKLILRSILKR